MKYCDITSNLIRNFLEWERETVYPELVLPGFSDLEKLSRQVEKCRKCPLGETRIRAVFGQGNPAARIMFIGEGPGYQEDHQGLPFVGRAGQLLDNLLKEVGLKRSDVYITNVVKCHPMVDPANPEKRGNDRPPHPEEVQACWPYLQQQISVIKPKVICALGAVAGQTLTGLAIPLGQMRRQLYDFSGIPLLVTYHPAAILRNDNLLPLCLQDFRRLLQIVK